MRIATAAADTALTTAAAHTAACIPMASATIPPNTAPTA